MEHRIDDPIATGRIRKAADRSRAPSDFAEAALDDVGRPKLDTLSHGEVQERQQLVKIPPQARHGLGGERFPATLPVMELGCGLSLRENRRRSE